MRAVTVVALAVSASGALFAGPIPPAHSQIGNSARCEAIADKQQRIACFEQAGVPVVDCNQPRNAQDAAFCAQIRGYRGAQPPADGNTIPPPVGSITPVAQPRVSNLPAPGDYCAIPNVITTLLNGLRNTPGMNDASLRDISTTSLDGDDFDAKLGDLGPTFVCHATLVQANGTAVPGRIVVVFSAGNYRKITWTSDADHQKHAAARAAATAVQRAQAHSEKEEFEARVRARAANCTTGTRENCLMYARIQEERQQRFCTGSYISAARIIWASKAHGLPAEMTADQMTRSAMTTVHYAEPLSGDLLISLIGAGYSGNWKSGEEFAQEAQRRCLNGNPF